MPLQNSFKIGIYSLGLIGGSLYKNLLKNGGAQLYVCSQNQKTLDTIKSDEVLASSDINILKDCDIVFVCSPISKTVEVIKQLYGINKNMVIADVSSVKSDILSEIDKLEGCRFVASHPMAGTENSGFTSSFSELFEGAVWVLTPSKYALPEDIKLVEIIVSLTGATPVVMGWAEHDAAVAMVSHLPMLLSQSLMLSAKDNPSALLLASSGFRDTTRLAMSNKIMAKDMLVLNRNNIKDALKLVIENAQKLLDSDFFDENIDKIIDSRSMLYNSEGKNNLRNNG